MFLYIALIVAVILDINVSVSSNGGGLYSFLLVFRIVKLPLYWCLNRWILMKLFSEDSQSTCVWSCSHMPNHAKAVLLWRSNFRKLWNLTLIWWYGDITPNLKSLESWLSGDTDYTSGYALYLPQIYPSYFITTIYGCSVYIYM
jgi:hypothetical protein